MQFDAMKRKIKSSEQQEIDNQIKKHPLLNELKQNYKGSIISDAKIKTVSEISLKIA